MLCPEVANFPPPKTVTSMKQKLSLEEVIKRVGLNDFYMSLVITCPDEIKTPTSIEELITEDSDYYKLSECSLTEFLEPAFIENFIIKGNLFCLSADRNSIIENCVAISRDGVLILHILEYIYQTLGIEGTKRPHNFYEVKIDLKNSRLHNKMKVALSKLELFDLYLVWEPHQENICPSSIAKYFFDRDIKVSTHSLTLKHISPNNINTIPSIKDVDAEDMIEWIGMLAHEAELNEPEMYISSYSTPESEYSLETSRISILVVKGFIPSILAEKVCKTLLDYCLSRQLDNYWTSIGIQSQENSPWQWNISSPKMFQCQDSSYNVFFSKDSITSYFVGQIKYS